MIIYGTNGTHFATPALPDATCPACHTRGQLHAALVSRYAHVYWLPLFPYQKLAVVQCDACQANWTDKSWPAELAPAARAAKSQARHPAWTWAGLALVLLIATYGLLSGLRDRHTDEALLESPRAGDIYTVRADSANMYSLLKVRQVSGNSVELVANEYQSDNATPIQSLNEPARYSKEPFVLTRLDLQIMRRKGQLTDVDRLEPQ